MGMRRCTVVIEEAGGNGSADVPDLPGCVSAGQTIAEAEAKIRKAIAFHIEGFCEDGLAVPAPEVRAEYVEAEAG